MNGDELTGVIGGVFSKVFGKNSKFHQQVNRNEVASWDSARHVMFMVELEKAFKCRFNGAEILEMISVPAIERIIKEKINLQ